MKKKLFIPLTILFLGMGSFRSTAGEISNQRTTTDQAIYESVNKELSSFLQIIPADLEKEHGFNSRSEFTKATPASIYKIIGVGKDGQAFETNLYNVVVAVNGEYRAMLTVSVENGHYEIETIGAALLAEELQVFEKANPLPSGKERIMLNVYTRASSFVAYQDATTNIENAELLPLESAKTGLAGASTGRALKTSYSFSEALQALQLN